MSGDGTVSLIVEGSIGYIEFDHQVKRNAMTVHMWQSLPDVCGQLQANPDVRVIVLRGAGDDAFVSGADISQFTDDYRPGTAGYNEMVSKAYAAVVELTKPTIAQVHGFCVGGGLAIACSTDFRIAAEGSLFGLPPARLGVGYSPAGIGSLVDLVGPAAVNEMVFSADLVDADTAARWGLVNHVVAPDELAPFVGAKAQVIAKRAPMSQYAAKLAVRAHLAPTSANRTAAADSAAACLKSDDYSEGVAAFKEKRSAIFTGK